jgi:hypothetical protein
MVALDRCPHERREMRVLPQGLGRLEGIEDVFRRAVGWIAAVGWTLVQRIDQRLDRPGAKGLNGLLRLCE